MQNSQGHAIWRKWYEVLHGQLIVIPDGTWKEVDST